MGFTHHSNYVRWMEEARVAFMDSVGWCYQRFEDEGIVSPVTAVECKFRHSTTFPDKVYIDVSVDECRARRRAALKDVWDLRRKVYETIICI